MRYHDDKVLIDRLMSAADISSVQVSIRDRTFRTAQQLANRIGNRFSDIIKTAGACSAQFARSQDTVYLEGRHYTLGQDHGRAFGRSVKPFGNRGATRRASGGEQKGRFETLSPA